MVGNVRRSNSIYIQIRSFNGFVEKYSIRGICFAYQQFLGNIVRKRTGNEHGFYDCIMDNDTIVNGGCKQPEK